MTVRSRTSSIMVIIRLEHLELFAHEFGKIAEFDCLHSSIYKCYPISTKVGQNEYNYKILDEFDYGCNRTRTVKFIIRPNGGIMLHARRRPCL